MIKFLLFIFAISYAIASFPEFNIQRMNTNYSGVISNNDKILCYGNYGIITYSSNFGDTWYRINIGDEYNIKKIINFKNQFFGITDNHLIYSNNGIEWQKKLFSDSDTLKTIFANKNDLYFYSNKNLYQINQNLEYSHFYMLDTTQFKDIEATDESIFLINNNELFELNINNKDFQKINIDYDKISEMANRSNWIDNIKVKNNTLYILFVYRNKYTNGLTYQMQNIFKYKEEFELISEKLFLYDNNYILKDDNLYLFKTERFNYDNFSCYLLTTAKAIGKDKLEVISDTSRNEIENSIWNPSWPKLDIAIKGAEQVNDSVFVLSGDNNFIAVSKNNGVNWNIHSYIKLTSNRKSPFYFDNNNILFSPNTLKFTKTTNSGVTWLPPKYSESLAQFNATNQPSTTIQAVSFINKEKGAILDMENIFKTFDSGRTYSYVDYPFDIDDYYLSDYDGTVINNTSIFGLYKRFDPVETRILEINENLEEKIISTVDSTLITGLFRGKGENLLAFGIYKKGYIENDSSYVFKDIDYVLLKSEDKGKTWFEYNKDIPLELDIMEGKYFIDYYNEHYQYKNFILIPDQRDSSKHIVVYDIENNIFDEIYVPSDINRVNIISNLFNYKNKLCYISNSYKLYWTDDFNLNKIKWDSLDITKYFNNWNSFDYYNPEPELDIIQSAWANNDQIFLVTGKSYIVYFYGSMLLYLDKLNFVKLLHNNNHTDVSDIVETYSDYIWLSDPYPNPSNNIIKSKVYWNYSINTDNLNYSIYDLNGNELKNIQVDFNVLDETSGVLKWYCTNYKKGIYFINIKYGNISKTVKVILN